MENEARQMTLCDLDSSFGKMSPEHFHPQQEKTSRQCSKKQLELLTTQYLYLDLREGYGNLLGAFWEVNSPLLGEFSMLNTGVSPNDAKESFLSQILEDTPLPKYYLSKTACLGILRRSKARDKELPFQLKKALEIQAGITHLDQDLSNNLATELRSYHINQRNEGIDLNGISGALMETQNMQMQTFITEPMICLNDQGGNRMDITENITSTLRACMGGHLPIVTQHFQKDVESERGETELLFDNHAKDCRYTGPLHVAPTIAATYGTGGNNVPLVSKHMNDENYCIASNIINRQDKNGGNGCGFQENISYTLTTADIHAVCSIPKAYQNIVGALCVGDEKGIGNQYVSQDKCIIDYQEMTSEKTEDTEIDKRTSSINLVRRLTPLECERLQGFPDGWTDIPKASDSPRYKALGNSVAVPCVDFIMHGIACFLRKIRQEEEER